jgi:hypothetical protein
MADTGEQLETSLPRLADLMLSQLDAVHPVALRQSLELHRDRLKKEQEPINSFQASIPLQEDI